MYCKKCNNLVETEDLICPNCNFNNEAYYESTKELNLKEMNKELEKKEEKNKKAPIAIIILLIILSFGIVSIYVFSDSKAKIDEDLKLINNTTTIKSNKKFKYDNFILYYPNTYGTSTNTIFNKNDNRFNITIKTILESEYNDIINSNDTLDSNLGEIETKTFANDNSYSHVFINNNKYYEIVVNYVLEDESDTTKELANILNSIKIK